MEKARLITTVTAAQSGDQKALNLLFNEYYNDIYYFALKTVKDSDLASDITQEAFVEILRTLGDLKEPAAFLTWAKQITYHQCTRYFKKKKDILLDEDEEGNTVLDTLVEDNGEFIPDEALDRNEFRKAIMEILNQLTEDQRSAVMMYYFDELSVDQIARIQDVPSGTVKSRLNYSRNKLRTFVEEYEKKNNIKLHAIPLFPIFHWLFEGISQSQVPLSLAQGIAKGIAASTGISLTVGTAGTAAGAGAAAGGLGTKIAAGIIAAALTAGGVTTAVIIANKDDPKDSYVMETAESFYNPTNFAYDLNCLSVKPRHVYWKDGELWAECFIINGYEHAVYNIEVNGISFSTLSGEIIAEAEDFGPLEGVTIGPYSYITWTFRFPKECCKNYGCDLSNLSCRFSTSNSY